MVNTQVYTVLNARLCLYFVGAQQLLRRAAFRRREAFRPGTRANVRSHVLLYIAFTQVFQFPDFPAAARTLLAFAEFLLLSFTAPKSVLNALGSVRHFHLDLQMPVDAFDNRSLVLWRRALPFTCRHITRPAPPLGRALLTQLCQLSLQLGDSGRVLAALMALLYASMARSSSLVAGTYRAYDSTRLPTLADIQTRAGVWHLRIKWAKNQQDADGGYWVPLIPIPSSHTCPVARWKDLRALSVGLTGTNPLFWCPVQRQGRAATRRPLTMTVARAWLGVLLQRLGRHQEGFTFHSFRRGACSSAFEQGATQTDLRALGGWRSEAVNCYLPAGEQRRRAAEALANMRSASLPN